ncbi:MAG: sigma-54-dependent Fis family transcriptional regulator, partial [Bdellovibrionales bacterium]|nr:sigma-54-dependent Fis family transcriptional regulator [Bdellovibrionales bacterium]
AKACVFRELTRDNQMLRASMGTPALEGPYIAKAPKMAELMTKVGRLATLDATVLLLGESGTGKTRLAHYIHTQRRSKQAPFVTVNCAAIPRELLEAELFGFERGAFTGAHQARQGAAELADGGTLFLDEIGELPLELQPKLLSFLQDRLVRRLGSGAPRKVELQIVASTNRDLEEMVAAREFRQDLYFRVNVLALDVPPLRERQEDILPLAEAILAETAKRRGLPPYMISPEAATALVNYRWPGNIRELENVLERATAFAEGRLLNVADLELPDGSPDEPDILRQFDFAGLTLEMLERKALLDTLKHTQGNKAEAAKLLGISTKSVYNKLARYDEPSGGL